MRVSWRFKEIVDVAEDVAGGDVATVEGCEFGGLDYSGFGISIGSRE